MIELGFTKVGFYISGNLPEGKPFFYEYDWTDEDRQNAHALVYQFIGETFICHESVKEPERYGQHPDFDLPIYISTTLQDSAAQRILKDDGTFMKYCSPEPQYVVQSVIKSRRIKREGNVSHYNFGEHNGTD